MSQSDLLDKETTRVGENGNDLHHPVSVHRSTEQAFLPVYHGSKIANPSPLAFSAVAVSLFLVSQVALGTDELSSLSIIVTVALGYSAVALLVAGIWEFPSGNPFGAALYTSLSGLFFSLALLLSPWSDVSTSYTNTAEFPTAVSQYFFAWFITIFVFIVAAHRSSGGLVIFLSLVDLTLLFLGLAYKYPGKTSLLKAGGAFGIVASFVAWYATLASLLDNDSLFRLPVLLDFTKKRRS